MTDQNNSDNFSFGPFRNAAKTYGPVMFLQHCQESAVCCYSACDGSLTARAERRRTEALPDVILLKPDEAASSLAYVSLRVSGCTCGTKGPDLPVCREWRSVLSLLCMNKLLDTHHLARRSCG